MPSWGLTYFQDSNSFVMEQLMFFHDFIMIVLVGVMFLVGYFLAAAWLVTQYSRAIHAGQRLEGMWTVLPGVLLIFIVFPSLKVLYYMEEGGSTDFLISVLGHQWYWTYEYLSMMSEGMESYMLSGGSLRLLEADNWLTVPFGVGIKMVVSSVDVIHSWTVPVMGVKTDAVPGRLNQIFLLFNRPGTFVGQCSEICGANHSFMPVTVLVSSVYDFFSKMVL